VLIFDQLSRNDPQLRLLARIVLGGMVILLCGLWWVQVVSSRYYRQRLEIQSVRTVRIPAVRGSILDRNGRSLAENSPCYNIGMYLEDLSARFQTASLQAQRQLRTNMVAQEVARLGRPMTSREKRKFSVPQSLSSNIQVQARYFVASNIAAELSRQLGEPVSLTQKDFQRSYDRTRALPLTVMPNANPRQLARFEEQSTLIPGMDLDIQSIRKYPRYFTNTPVAPLAAHLLGYVNRSSADDADDDEIRYNYRIEDYHGVTGIERQFDRQLRGRAGAKSVLVNNLGYRKGESVWSPPEPGQNVYLTIDAEIQAAAEKALREAHGGLVRGAVVVMDPRNGDILAMASSPTYSPNYFVGEDDTVPWDNLAWTDKEIGAQKNRAMYENYHPGSIFKIVVGLAALELGLNPDETFEGLGYYKVGGRSWNDLAGPGNFNFKRALAKSSNAYFIHNGLKPGVLQKVVELGQRLHLGQRTGLLSPGQETPGIFPSPQMIARADWFDGNTANLSIGQGYIDVTPVQMAVMVSAVANGGTVFYPRVALRTEPQGVSGEVGQQFPQGRVRDNLGVSRRSLDVVRSAMFDDVNTTEGTGHPAFIAGFPIAGKTGTAQVEKHGKVDLDEQNTWFASYAPYDSPRYVVIATVEGRGSGGGTCAPIAKKIYEVILKIEQRANRGIAANNP
jgi:penicillin-binding protein 2